MERITRQTPLPEMPELKLPPVKFEEIFVNNPEKRARIAARTQAEKKTTYAALTVFNALNIQK